MVRAFFYLTACSFRNRVRRRLQRLREPRYAIGLVVGMLYLWFMVFRNVARRHGAGPGAAAVRPAALANMTGAVQVAGSVALLAVAAIAWVWPGAGRPIAFSRSEVQFLFPAPVTRRELVHFKVLRSQLAILFSSALVTVFMRPASLASGWTLLAGIWVLLMVVRLHLMGVALRRASLARHGASGMARQWVPLAVVLGAVGIVVATAVRAWPTLTGLVGSEQVIEEIRRLATTGAAGAVLWPFRALVALPLSASAVEFGKALPAALGLLALNYAWVLRSDAAFEDASAEQAEKRAVRRAAPRASVKGAAATPFTLGAEGPPETAILWKNLIFVGRFVSLRTLVRVLPIIVVFGIVASQGGAGGIAATLAAICLPLAAFTALMGAQMMRNDLRQDLANLALLKTWPVRGAAIMRGEVLGPTVVMTAVTWLLLLAAAVLGSGLRSSGAAQSWFLAHRFSFMATAAVLAPALILAQTVVQNGLAVLFPAWVRVGAGRSRGIEAMGQRLLMLAGILLILLVSVLPGVLVAAAFTAVVYWATGRVFIVVPALIVAAVMAGECWLAVEGLGRVLEKTDVGAVDSAE